MEKRKIKDATIAAAAIILLYVFFHLVGIGCPIKFFTGISCPGCGMTRAWGALLHLDFAKAFYYHPLFFIPPFMAVVFLLKNKLSVKIYKFIIFTVFALFVIIYAYRMFGPYEEIVSIDLRKNILLRIYDFLF